MTKDKYMKYYIYKTVNLLNNRYYFGCHATDNLNDNYLGSGKILKRAIKKYGKNCFKKEIIEFCDSMTDMFLKEEKLITIDVVNDPITYNCCLGGRGGYRNISDIGKKSISNARKNKVVIKENDDTYKVIDKELFDKKKMHGATYGKTTARTISGKYIVVTNDEFTNNSELVGTTKGKTVVKDITGKISVVDVNDYRIKTGELVGITKYSKQTPESNLKRSLTLTGYVRGKQKIVRCPHCNKTGGISNMKRWHFDNCKYKQN